MNRYIYILLAIVCAAFGVKLTSRTISVTSHYINESIQRETLTDYSIVDKRFSHSRTKGSVILGYTLTVSYADSLYLVEVPADVYDQVNPGIGVKLENNELYYDHEHKSVIWPSENKSEDIIDLLGTICPTPVLNRLLPLESQKKRQTINRPGGSLRTAWYFFAYPSK